MKTIIEYINEKLDANDINIEKGNPQEILKLCKGNNDWKLFDENFKKNHDSFPGLSSINDAEFLIAKYNDEIVGVQAYAYPDKLKKYRDSHEDDHTSYAHLFDAEVLESMRQNGIFAKMINATLDDLKKKHIDGATLMAIDQEHAGWYAKKFGFKTYEGDEKVTSPMMYKKL